MKKYSILILMFFTAIATACPVCERNQPKVLRGIVHGAGPESTWDYLSIIITIIAALVTLFFTIKWVVKPGERNTDHIKYSIFKSDQ